MALHVDEAKFAQGHNAFLRRMYEHSGVPFTSFHHEFLYKDEIAFKSRVFSQASEVLNLNRWKSWQKTPGKILKAVKQACSPTISKNLLEQRFGPSNVSHSPLYKVHGHSQVAALEDQLFSLLVGSSAPKDFGPRFDSFTTYLKTNHLGCKWPFPAYLSFLLSPQLYFPIRPARMDALLRFYGSGEKISGAVNWDRYSVLLELGTYLRDKLAFYGPASALELQSYMWEVSYVVVHNLVSLKQAPAQTPDFANEFDKRAQAARERERIGLAGEKFVYEQERIKLQKSGRSDLAAKVQPISINSIDAGYDIRSFDLSGSEIHIEVKTTIANIDQDRGFWLAEAEKLRAEKHERWTVYRVFAIDSSPNIEPLGNIVTHGNQEWELTPSSWYVKRHQPPSSQSPGKTALRG